MRTCAMLLLASCITSAALGQQPPTAPGLQVRLYELAQGVSAIPELRPSEKPNAVQVVPTLDLRTAAGGFGELKENFLTEVVGLLTITQPAEYAFRLVSDDGSQLWIDHLLIIDHDGPHGATPKDGRIPLDPGSYPLRVLHFQGGGDGQLTLLWQPLAPATQPAGGPGAAAVPDAFVPIPPTALSHATQPPVGTAPGKKQIIPALRKGRPGDGTPAGPNPAYRSVEAGSDVISPETWLTDGRLAVIGMPYQAGQPLVAWLPPNAEREYSAFMTGPFVIGAFEGQVRVYSKAENKRLALDNVAGRSQGAVFRFGPARPLLQSTGEVAFEMRAIRAHKNGLELEFTRPLDPRVGWEPEAYQVEQWPLTLPAAGTALQPPRRDGELYPVKSASVPEDRKKVFLELASLKPGHVVYVRLLPPLLDEQGTLPFSTEAWYTLHALPSDRMGQVRPRPPQPPQNVLSAAERQEGWRLLFDGQSPAGWRGWKKDAFPAGWQVKDGCIVRSGPGGDLCTEEEFADFELALEWRISAGGNSGIFFRASEEFDWCWRTAPEMQVLDNAEHADGRNPKTSAGSNYALHAPTRDMTQPVGLWNQVRIVARGPHIEYWLNGTKVVEYETGSPAWEQLVAASKFKDMPNYGRTTQGRIVLQDHGDKVWYRNIKIRPLHAGK